MQAVKQTFVFRKPGLRGLAGTVMILGNAALHPSKHIRRQQ